MSAVNEQSEAGLESAGGAPVKRSAAIQDSQRRVRPPVDPASLEYRELREDEFWRQIPTWSQVSAEEFLDYRWQMKHSVNSEKKLLQLLDGWVDRAFLEDVTAGFHHAPMAVRVTPYILALIDWQNPYTDPLRTQFVPVASRLHPDHPMLTLDSLHEQVDAPVPGLTHRYPDKALFLALDTCPVYCRFCTRSYAIGVDTDMVEKVKLKVDPSRWEAMFRYIESRPELEDIVISGGDAFNLAAKHISHIGRTLLEMPNIRRIRYATKGLAVMPSKILTDPEWLDAVTEVHDLGRRTHKEVAIHTHFGHANEITGITRRALNVLFERGIKVRNQTVIQRGVNDSIPQMIRLVKRLSEINVQPYYAYQHDMVAGVEDLRTSLQSTLDIAKAVRGSTAGFNTPTFCVDAPGGGGKREASSFEHYDRETGISVYAAPTVKPGELFFYFDPLHSLSDEARQRWQDPAERTRMIEAAREAALATR